MPNIEPFSVAGWSGEVRSDLAPALSEILSSIGEASAGIKTGGARRVVMGKLPDGQGRFVLKEYLYPGFLDRVAAAVRGSRARKEWRNLVALWNRGVRVPHPILWAETSEGSVRRSLVVMAFLDAVPISDLLSRLPSLPAHIRFALARALGNTLATFHAAGALHGDAHPGNLLVSGLETDPAVWVIDLHQVSIGRSTTWRERLWNLAEFLKGQSDRLSIGDKHRILSAYLETLTDYSPPFPNAAEARRSMSRAIEEFSAGIHARWWHSRLAKCTEHGKRFHRLEAGKFTGWIRTEWDSPEFRERLADPARLLEDTASTVVKAGDTTTVARVLAPGRDQPLMLKGYNRKDFWERTKNQFRRSRAMKVWRAGYALELLNIQTPRIVCVLERKWGPFLVESFILTKWTEGGIGYDEFYRTRYGDGALSDELRHEKRQVERAVAFLFAKLHRNQISHGDLKGRNILVQPDRPIPFDPAFVDLDAMSLHPIRFRRSRVNDLARLLFSLHPLVDARCAWQFLRDYSLTHPEVWKKRRWWWKAIWRRTERKIREKGLAG